MNVSWLGARVPRSRGRSPSARNLPFPKQAQFCASKPLPQLPFSHRVTAFTRYFQNVCCHTQWHNVTVNVKDGEGTVSNDTNFWTSTNCRKNFAATLAVRGRQDLVAPPIIRTPHSRASILTGLEQIFRPPRGATNKPYQLESLRAVNGREQTSNQEVPSVKVP